MSEVNIFFATGFEEVEALTVVDLLRRAGVGVDMVSVTGDRFVKGSHDIVIEADKLFEELDENAKMLVLPGGMPGTSNLKAHKGLESLIKRFYEDGRYLAAICAAPTVFGEMGLLRDRMATCYPGMEEGLVGANALTDGVVIDGRIVTSRGLGSAISFGLCLVGILKGTDTAEDIASKIVYNTEV